MNTSAAFEPPDSSNTMPARPDVPIRAGFLIVSWKPTVAPTKDYAKIIWIRA